MGQDDLCSWDCGSSCILYDTGNGCGTLGRGGLSGFVLSPHVGQGRIRERTAAHFKCASLLLGTRSSSGHTYQQKRHISESGWRLEPFSPCEDWSPDCDICDFERHYQIKRGPTAIEQLSSSTTFFKSSNCKCQKIDMSAPIAGLSSPLTYLRMVSSTAGRRIHPPVVWSEIANPDPRTASLASLLPGKARCHLRSGAKALANRCQSPWRLILELMRTGQCTHRGAIGRLPCCLFTIFMRNVCEQSGHYGSLVRAPQPQSVF